MSWEEKINCKDTEQNCQKESNIRQHRFLVSLYLGVLRSSGMLHSVD